MISNSQIQVQQQVLSPQQIQAMKIVELPVQQLEERIQQELVENPALEEGVDEDDLPRVEEDDDYSDASVEGNEEIDWTQYIDDDEEPEYRSHANNGTPTIGGAEIPFSVGESFLEMLQSQLDLHPLTERQKTIAKTVIGSIDERGYLVSDAERIVDTLAFKLAFYCDEQEVEEMIQLVQTLDPAGVGARDLQECLSIQLRRKPQTDDIRLATTIVEEYFDDFSHKRFPQMMQRLEIEEEDLKRANAEIVKLTPQPGGAMNSNIYETNTIIPDLEVDSSLDVHLFRENIPSLRISRSFSDFIKDFQGNKQNQTRANKDAVAYYRKRIDDARWFIDAIKKRDDTLLRVMREIVRHQHAFFISGDESLLHPMILKNVADSILTPAVDENGERCMKPIDISTVSRACNGKYVSTEYGVFPLKFFFSEAYKTEDNEEISTRRIKHALSELIEKEDKQHPLTDEKLVELLTDQGFPIARRTVAKYRGMMGIPVASQRRGV